MEGVASPLARPGRLSYMEPLVHTIGNWVLDRVLGTMASMFPEAECSPETREIIHL